jgi:hypothetical protein
LADRSPGITVPLVIESIENQFAKSYSLVERPLPPTILEDAHGLVDDHLPRVA